MTCFCFFISSHMSVIPASLCVTLLSTILASTWTSQQLNMKDLSLGTSACLVLTNLKVFPVFSATV